MYVYQELQLPKDEGELRKIQDYLYQVSRENFIKGEVVNFKGLKEIAFCEVTIVTAIHKLKLNRGSNTPGVDGETMRTNILEQDYKEIINRVKTTVEN
ncbi:MAG: group II intron reverse transcriptase/maturase, partial [Candidatus Eremiobacterota bacterium]